MYGFGVKTPQNTPQSEPVVREGMLDDPSLSRQWVARRLQRALTVERWCGPARAGLARGRWRQLLSAHASASRRRAAQLEELIRAVGSEPYGSWGVGAPLTRAAATLPALVSNRLSGRIARLIAEHTLSEYRALQALVEDAAGVPGGLVDRIRPLAVEAALELEMLPEPQNQEDEYSQLTKH